MRIHSPHRAVGRGRIPRGLRLGVALVFAFAFVLGPSAPRPASADDLSDARAKQAALARQIADQKKQLASLTASDQSLQAEIASTKASLTNVSANLADVQRNIGTMRAQVAQVKAKYDGLVKQLGDLEAQLKSVETQEAAKAAQLQERKDVLAQRIVDAYETNDTSLLEQLLGARSLSDVLSDVSYYMDLSAQDRQLGTQIQHDQQTLAELHQTVEQTRQATEQMRTDTAAQKANLDRQLADLKGTEAKLAALQAQMQRQLAQQRNAEAKLAQNKSQLAATIRSNGVAQQALAKRIDSLIAAQAAAGNVPPSSGPLQWPMGGVITQEFGCTGVVSEPPLGNCAHFHQAIDIAAPYGTPVRAAAAGTVVFIGYNPYDAPPQAWIVIIAHSPGLNTWYAHMQASAPAGIYAGARVAKGQVIGYEGSTGHSSGPHLDWRVMQNGVFVNPRLFV